MTQDTERKHHMNRSIFLTSCGLSDEMKDSLLDVCRKAPEDLKVLLIPTAGLESDGPEKGWPSAWMSSGKWGSVLKMSSFTIWN